MNAGIVGHAGTPQLKRLVMESIKELRKLRNKSDQVISFGTASTDDAGVHLVRASSTKHQAPSTKHQASSAKLVKLQAASIKPQAQRLKLKAASNKLVDHGPWKKFHGTRTKGLY